MLSQYKEVQLLIAIATSFRVCDRCATLRQKANSGVYKVTFLPTQE